MNDWAGYLAFAERLSREEGEAELRSAVSRAYYSAYNAARLHVSRIEPMFLSRADDHRKVWQWYAERPGSARQIQTIGQALRTTRNAADYGALRNYKAEADAAVKKGAQDPRAPHRKLLSARSEPAHLMAFATGLVRARWSPYASFEW